MSLAIGFVIFIVIIPAFIVKCLCREEEMETNKENGRSSILFNATVSKRNTTPEEVFETLDKAGVKVLFLQNKSN